MKNKLVVTFSLFLLVGFLGMSGCNASYSNGGDHTNNDSQNDQSVNIDDHSVGSEEDGSGAVGCDEFRFPDGPFPGSNVWDPEGSSDDTLEISFDSRLFPIVFSSVEVFHLFEDEETGVVTTEGEFLVGSIDRDRFGRQSWRGEFFGGEYDGKVVVNVEGDLFCSFQVEGTEGVVD